MYICHTLRDSAPILTFPTPIAKNYPPSPPENFHKFQKLTKFKWDIKMTQEPYNWVWILGWGLPMLKKNLFAPPMKIRGKSNLSNSEIKIRESLWPKSWKVIIFDMYPIDDPPLPPLKKLKWSEFIANWTVFHFIFSNLANNISCITW